MCPQAPLLQEQRQEYERLSFEATQLASQLAQALTDRDTSERRSESFRLDVERLSTDNVILNQQLSDLGRQIRTLSRTLAKSENSSIEGELNDPSFDEEEAAILRRAEESGDTDSVVSAHLVTFRSINELQVQNQKLLKITRQMGQQLEKGEEDAAARRRGEENKAVEEAHELILRLKEEVESQRTRTEAYEKERDMFRRMLAQRGGAALGQNGTSEGGAAISGSDIEASRLLTEVQANFDAYKNEISVDTQRLREDLAQAQKDASAARTELAKSKAQSEFMAGASRAAQAALSRVPIVVSTQVLTLSRAQNASDFSTRHSSSGRARSKKARNALSSCSRLLRSKTRRSTRYAKSSPLGLQDVVIG